MGKLPIILTKYGFPVARVEKLSEWAIKKPSVKQVSDITDVKKDDVVSNNALVCDKCGLEKDLLFDHWEEGTPYRVCLACKVKSIKKK